MKTEAMCETANIGSPGKGLVNALCVFPTYIPPKCLCKSPKVTMLHLVNTVKILQVVLY